jgi:hypothetical protein
MIKSDFYHFPRWIMLVVAVLLAFGSPVLALFSEDFEPPFATGDLSIAPWSVLDGSPAIVSEAVELNVGDEQRLSIPGPDQLAIGTVEFDLYIASGGEFRWTARDTASWRVARLYFETGGGDVDVATSSGGANLVDGVMALDSWARFVLDFDHINELFSLEIDGNPVYTNMAYNEAGFGHDFSAELIYKLEWELVGGNDVLFDNVTVPADNVFTISGSVGVEAVVMNGLPGNPVSDVLGDFSQQVLQGWSGTVTPTRTGYDFIPVERNYSNVSQDYLNEDYSWTTTYYTISGNVGLSGVSLNGLPNIPVSDGSGDYSDLVPYDWNGTVTPSKSGWAFSPSQRVYTNVVADAPFSDYIPTEGTEFSTLQVVPSVPNSAETVAITLSGTWPDDAVPDESALSVFEGDIYFDVFDKEGGNPGGTAWQQMQVLGPLLPGVYDIFAAIFPETYDLIGWVSSLSFQQSSTLGMNPTQFQGELDQAGDSIQTARLAISKAMADLYERGIVDTYNETTVNLGFLIDELEGLNRTIFYVQGIVDTGPSALVVSQANQTIIDVVNDAAIVSDSFHNLFVTAIERADPVAALGVLVQDPVIRQIMENAAETLTALAFQVATARKFIADEMRRFRNDTGFKATFPNDHRYVPTPLPPVEVAPDGSLDRILFGFAWGRADTLLRLGFDTFPETSGADWNTNSPDDFSTNHRADMAAAMEKYQIKSPDSVMLYATGAGMYRPTWFADVYGEDPDYYFRPEYQGGGGFDYRHPVPRAMILEYLEGAAREAAKNPWQLAYKGPWEAHPYDVPGSFIFREFGHSVPAIAALRNYLQNKYNTISALNAAWQQSPPYASFDDIEPPEALMSGFYQNYDERGHGVHFPYWPVKRLKATPLTYEFERCRKDLYAEYFSDCYQALKRGDPNRPVASSNSGGIMNESQINSLDDLLMPDQCVDWWGKHPSGGIGWEDSPYLYGLNHYFNKTLVSLEYYGYGFQEFFPIYGPVILAEGATSNSVYNAMRRDVWHEYSWDRRVLLFYWPPKLVELWLPPGGNWLDGGINPWTAPMLQPWAGTIPVVKRRLTSLNDILINVPIIKPKIGILHAGVSIINAYPTDSVREITSDIFDRLISKQYHFDVVAEEYLVSDPCDPGVHHDTLDRYNVIILPYVQYFDDGFAAKLLSWVNNGGTLIALGPFGLYDKLGFDLSDGANLVYPGTTFSYTDPDYPLSWVWQASGSPPFTNGYRLDSYGGGTIMTTLDGRALYRPVVGIGAGTKRTSRPPASDIVDPGGYSAAQQAFYNTLAAATDRKAWVTSGNVEMVIRQEASGQGPLYLSLLNWDYHNALVTSVIVDGEYSIVSDLSVVGGVPVPVTINAGQTTIPMQLGPGEGLMLELQE